MGGFFSPIAITIYSTVILLSHLIPWISISYTWISKLSHSEGKVLYSNGKKTEVFWILAEHCLSCRHYIDLHGQSTYFLGMVLHQWFWSSIEMKIIQINFLYMLHTRLTHNGSESENLNFREMAASLALFYFLKCKTKNT